MLRQSLLLSLLVASATCAADEAPADDASPPTSADVAGPEIPAADRAAERTPVRTAAIQPKADAGGSKTLSGISILGNQEAPKALVIVPWKSSEIGDPLGLDKNLDGSRRPVDREVFMRELDYYDIRTGSK